MKWPAAGSESVLCSHSSVTRAWPAPVLHYNSLSSFLFSLVSWRWIKWKHKNTHFAPNLPWSTDSNRFEWGTVTTSIPKMCVDSLTRRKTFTQMAPAKRKCCLTPAPCGHATAQIASKEVDASWLSYVLGNWKGFHPYLNYYAAVVELFFLQRSGLHTGQSKTTIKITTGLMKAAKHERFPSL